MTDYSAHDIHRLDQAYPDALADLEEFIGNPVHKRRLAEVGPEVFAAEQTRDLAFSIDNPMSLAGLAAIATVRLMDAGKTWEEDTDAAWAKVDELAGLLGSVHGERTVLRGQLHDTRTELAKARAELADVRNQAHRADTDHQQTIRANTELANQRDQLVAEVAAAIAPTVRLGDTTQAVIEGVQFLHQLYKSWVADAHKYLAKADELTAERDVLARALRDIAGMVKQFDTPRDAGRVQVFVADVGRVARRAIDSTAEVTR